MKFGHQLTSALLVLAALGLVLAACSGDDSNNPTLAGPSAPAMAQKDLNEETRLRVSNLTSSSVTLSWVSEDLVGALVNYGPTTALGNSAGDAVVDDVHYITITGLQPETEYYFETVTGGVTDDNGGSYYQFRTAPIGVGVPYTVYQTVYMEDGLTPAGRVIAGLKLETQPTESAYLTCLTDANGLWSVNLGNLKDEETGEPYGYGAGDAIEVAVYGAAAGDGGLMSTVSGTSPQALMDLTLSLGTGGGCECLPGDADGNGRIDRKDLTYLNNYLRRGGPAPVPYEVCSGDADGNCRVDNQDVKFLREYLQMDGEEPVSCEEWVDHCGEY